MIPTKGVRCDRVKRSGLWRGSSFRGLEAEALEKQKQRECLGFAEKEKMEKKAEASAMLVLYSTVADGDGDTCIMN